MGNDSPDFALPHGVLAREVEGEMVLLNLVSEQYFGLDKVGTDIIKRLMRQPSSAALDELCNDYDVPADVLRADVDRLTEELLREGLLERVEPARS